jgi:hypothetical protein
MRTSADIGHPSNSYLKIQSSSTISLNDLNGSLNLIAHVDPKTTKSSLESIVPDSDHPKPFKSSGNDFERLKMIQSRMESLLITKCSSSIPSLLNWVGEFKERRVVDPEESCDVLDNIEQLLDVFCRLHSHNTGENL